MKIDIEELKRLAEAATPGPWIIEDLLSGEVVCASTRWPVAATIRHKPKLNSFPQKQKEVNTQYIAAANPAAVLELIRQRDELLIAAKDAHQVLRDWVGYIPSSTIQEDLNMLGIAIANAEKQS